MSNSLTSTYNFSYSTMADVYAIADAEEDEDNKKKILAFAEDIEAVGRGSIFGESYTLRSTAYGDELISDTDLLSEKEVDDYE